MFLSFNFKDITITSSTYRNTEYPIKLYLGNGGSNINVPGAYKFNNIDLFEGDIVLYNTADTPTNITATRLYIGPTASIDASSQVHINNLLLLL